MSAGTILRDLVNAPLGLRLLRVQQLRAGDVEPLADRGFADEVETVTTPEQRAAQAERIRRIRSAA